ncbi:MAG: bifunctional hydroxymethylpyrimidine kinase/phosphomethylpyrimidine kinase [Aliarcobacter sp.]|nr:bifunctional hydroxymethylpyrimidine kinase/phosphomethylpyrimidine kinase [Aliarcobacter sp.]
MKNLLKDLNIPIILDPVAISRAGSKLIDDEAIQSLKNLFKYSFLITPNKYEAKLFFDVNKIEDIEKIKKSTNEYLI